MPRAPLLAVVAALSVAWTWSAARPAEACGSVYGPERAELLPRDGAALPSHPTIVLSVSGRHWYDLPGPDDLPLSITAHGRPISFEARPIATEEYRRVFAVKVYAHDTWITVRYADSSRAGYRVAGEAPAGHRAHGFGRAALLAVATGLLVLLVAIRRRRRLPAATW